MIRFILQKESGEITSEGKRLGRLNSSESDVLEYLYMHNGELVSRDKLLDVGWPKKIVTPNSLNVAIKNIRTCFEKINIDDAITTHVKKGFSWNSIYYIDIIRTPDHEPNLDVEERCNKATSQPIKIECAVQNNQQKTTSDIIMEKGGRLVKDFSYVGRYLLLTLLLLVSTLIAIWYAIYFTPIACYEIKSARLCGVGVLNKSSLPVELPPGEYVYGFKIDSKGFFYEKI